MSNYIHSLFPYPDIRAVIGVDDYKGRDSGNPDSPRVLDGRLLLRSDASAVERLFEALDAAKAPRWHASAHGMRGLFTIPEAQREAIWSSLRVADTHVFGTTPTSTMLSECHLDDQWDALRRSNPSLMAGWGKGREGRGLFRFVSNVHGQAHQRFPSLNGSRLLFVVDRQDWFHPSSHAVEPAKGFVELPMFVDPSATHAPPVVWVRTSSTSDCDTTLSSLINLIDSEVWAFGRLLSTPDAQGKTVHEAMQNWRFGDRSKEPLAHHAETAIDDHIPPAAQAHFEEFYIRASDDGRVHVI